MLPPAPSRLPVVIGCATLCYIVLHCALQRKIQKVLHFVLQIRGKHRTIVADDGTREKMGSLLLRDTGIILQLCKVERCALDNNTCPLLKSNALLYNCQAVMLISTTNHCEPLLLLPCGGFGAGGQLSELALLCLKFSCEGTLGFIWCGYTSSAVTPSRSSLV